MRQHFNQQLSLGQVPISEIEINLKCRHELPPILASLQFIFVNPDLHQEIFTILGKNIIKDNNYMGRPGMSLWEVFVLSVVRLGMDVDYDFLVDLANEHDSLRGILGVRTSDFSSGKKYKYQTVVDNIHLVEESMLKQINEVIVNAGHRMIKKKRKRRR